MHRHISHPRARRSGPRCPRRGYTPHQALLTPPFARHVRAPVASCTNRAAGGVPCPTAGTGYFNGLYCAEWAQGGHTSHLNHPQQCRGPLLLGVYSPKSGILGANLTPRIQILWVYTWVYTLLMVHQGHSNCPDVSETRF